MVCPAGNGSRLSLHEVGMKSGTAPCGLGLALGLAYGVGDGLADGVGDGVASGAADPAIGVAGPGRCSAAAVTGTAASTSAVAVPADTSPTIRRIRLRRRPSDRAR
jgi:hypothetical protein